MGAPSTLTIVPEIEVSWAAALETQRRVDTSWKSFETGICPIGWHLLLIKNDMVIPCSHRRLLLQYRHSTNCLNYEFQVTPGECNASPAASGTCGSGHSAGAILLTLPIACQSSPPPGPIPFERHPALQLHCSCPDQPQPNIAAITPPRPSTAAAAMEARRPGRGGVLGFLGRKKEVPVVPNTLHTSPAAYGTAGYGPAQAHGEQPMQIQSGCLRTLLPRLPPAARPPARISGHLSPPPAPAAGGSMHPPTSNNGARHENDWDPMAAMAGWLPAPPAQPAAAHPAPPHASARPSGSTKPPSGLRGAWGKLKQRLSRSSGKRGGVADGGTDGGGGGALLTAAAFPLAPAERQVGLLWGCRAMGFAGLCCWLAGAEAN